MHAVHSWRRHRGREPGEQREGIHVHRGGAVAERPLQRDAHQLVGQQAQPLLRDRRAQNVLDELVLAGRVVGAHGGAGVQREAELGDRERPRDGDARLAAQRDGLERGALPALGARRRETADGGRGELGERRLVLRGAVTCSRSVTSSDDSSGSAWNPGAPPGSAAGAKTPSSSTECQWGLSRKSA